MAEEDDTERTEDPTARKLEQAHEKGDVPKSYEVVTFFTMAAVAMVVGMAGPRTAEFLYEPLRGLIEHSGDMPLNGGEVHQLFVKLGLVMGGAVLVPVLIMMLAGVSGHAVQHKLVFSLEKTAPKLSKISPLAGLKRLFSMESLVNFIKGLAKLGLVGASMVLVLWPRHEQLVGMISLDLVTILALTQSISLEMLGSMLAVMFLIASADLLYVRFTWFKRQRMSLQEIKDEHKQMEGDPTLKAKVRQIRSERARKRMMAAVPTATVVITNPTHYAVALKYEPGMQAPVCVAKGVDDVALRIRELAGKSKVTIVENPPLARTLYATVDIDALVPEQHYKAVAEVIGYVMNLKKSAGGRS